MRRALLLPAVCLLAWSCGTAGVEDIIYGPDTVPGTQMTTDERTLALEVFALVNEARAENELPPLVWNEAAADVAYDHAVDMRVRGFYDHVNPDGVGACERLMARQIPMDGCGGENIARNNPSPRDVMDAWLASPSHRPLILAPGVTHLGVGVHTGRDGPWWVQQFYRYTGP